MLKFTAATFAARLSPSRPSRVLVSFAMLCLILVPSAAFSQSHLHRDAITLERTGGLGGPLYVVTVQKGGGVTWWGKAGVRVKGKIHSGIPSSSAARLFDSVHAMSFFTVKQVPLDACTTDGGEVTITVKEGEAEHTISSYCEITEGLGQLADQIDEEVHTIRWAFIDVLTLKRLIASGSFNVTKSGPFYMQQAIDWDSGGVIGILAKHGVNANGRNSSNETYLMNAVFDNRYEAAKALLDAGANPTDPFPPVKQTPAINAGFRGAKMVKLFLDRHVPVDDADARGWTMLMGAACQAHLDAVKLIVEAGANVNARNAQGQTAIDVAKEYRDKYYKGGVSKELDEVIAYLEQHSSTR